MNESARLRCTVTYSSPIGELLLTSDDGALTGLHMAEHDGKDSPAPGRGLAPGRFGVSQASATSCEPTSRASCATFELPLRMAGTPFQRLVWEGLLEHPVRSDRQLRRARPADRASRGVARGRSRQRPQPHRASSFPAIA